MLPHTLCAGDGSDIVVLQNVSAHAGQRLLLESFDLRMGRQRVAIIGPNGAGKTTLLEIILGHRKPTLGSAFRDSSRIGSISQGGANWMLDESLAALLKLWTSPDGDGDVGKLLLAHKFPLALAGRPMHSLSPGERTRAALICLFRRSPTPELLVLDEPTHGLDLVGQSAMTSALAAWPGGLIVTSHDREFLEAIKVDRVIRLER